MDMPYFQAMPAVCFALAASVVLAAGLIELTAALRSMIWRLVARIARLSFK
jgi:ABC-type dipeptide/oligopeptide/nickel transport system permease subunit